MYAQLVEGGTTPARRTEMDQIVTDEMVPALEAEPGFAGAPGRPRERRRDDDHPLGVRIPGPPPARRVRRRVPEGARQRRRHLHRHPSAALAHPEHDGGTPAAHAGAVTPAPRSGRITARVDVRAVDRGGHRQLERGAAEIRLTR